MAKNNKKVKVNHNLTKSEVIIKVVAGILAGIMVFAFAGTLMICLTNI